MYTIISARFLGHTTEDNAAKHVLILSFDLSAALVFKNQHLNG